MIDVFDYLFVCLYILT